MSHFVVPHAIDYATVSPLFMSLVDTVHTMVQIQIIRHTHQQQQLENSAMFKRPEYSVWSHADSRVKHQARDRAGDCDTISGKRLAEVGFTQTGQDKLHAQTSLHVYIQTLASEIDT